MNKDHAPTRHQYGLPDGIRPTTIPPIMSTARETGVSFHVPSTNKTPADQPYISA